MDSDSLSCRRIGWGVIEASSLLSPDVSHVTQGCTTTSTSMALCDLAIIKTEDTNDNLDEIFG